MEETKPAPQGEPVPEPAQPEPERPPAPARRTPAEPLFDGGDKLFLDSIARANWAVPWSDLMMTMFVLFAALMAVQALQDRTKQQAGEIRKETATQQATAPSEKPPVKDELPIRKPSFEPLMQINVLAKSQEAVREANLQNAEIVLMDDQSVKVSVQGPMFFAAGKADLRPEAINFLDRLAQIIRQTPYDIHVVGHADHRPINTPMFPSNWELSLVRASHVARYLIKSGGLDPSRFVVMGRGEYEPASTSEDLESLALNRRVEIIITRNVNRTQGALSP